MQIWYMSNRTLDMVDDKPDRNSVLTSEQRDFLRKSEEEQKEDYTRQGRSYHRTEIRERARAALWDFDLLTDELDEKEREKIFSPEPRTGAGAVLEDEVAGVLQFLCMGMNGSIGFSRPLKRGVANAEARMGTVRSALDVSVRFTIDPVWNGDIQTITGLVEHDQWDRVDISDLPPFIGAAKRADAIDFDKIRDKLAENEWFQKYRSMKKRVVIPGGHSTPLMDPEVFEREGIGEMNPEELREKFGEGYPDALHSPIYDGEKVFRPPPFGEPDGEIEILEWIDEPDGGDE